MVVGPQRTVVVLLLLGIVLPVAAVSSGITALTNRARAEERKLQLKKQDHLIKQYSAVYRDIGDAISSNDIPRAKGIISAKTGFLFDQTVKAQEKLADIVTEQGDLSSSSSGSVSGVTPTKVAFHQRVYIQFAGSYTRAQITSLNAALRDAGWDMQSASGERTENARAVNQVRFGPGGERAAAELANAINSSSVRPGTPLKPVPVAIVGTGKLEVWMSN